MKPQSISDSGISADFRNLAGAINLRSSCTQELQQSQTSDTVSSAPDKRPALQIPDGTPIEIEAPYTFRSMDFKPNDKISFRVVDPVKIDGITVIEQGATATGRINKSKRGPLGQGWSFGLDHANRDAVDGSQIPVRAAPVRLRGDSKGATVGC